MVQQERAARTRESLVRAAAEVFAAQGFVPATLGAISRRAGVSAGALHFHFESKHALARAVEAAALVTLHRITRQAEQAHPGALQRLIAAGEALLHAVEQDVVVRAGFQLVGPAAWRTGPLDLRDAWQRWVETLLHTARREGTLAGGVSPARAAAAVVAATVGFAVLGLTDPQWLSRRTLAQYWDLMLPRLTPSPPPPPEAPTAHRTTPTTPTGPPAPHPPAPPAPHPPDAPHPPHTPHPPDTQDVPPTPGSSGSPGSPPAPPGPAAPGSAPAPPPDTPDGPPAPPPDAPPAPDAPGSPPAPAP
ncbi:ScbR family autoregulator-binding transcription factor [Streptomyces sp. KL118A]|uniref:ScbR family autoregulator-binding transcription factor n=1 Tax=Streptomyces sp. KL118A TaxID=3045153 RepID=UPI00278C086C|nr:ScbR family autoregulator-binding transcription factor [Streptomyces sp. KL118A]